MPETFWSTWTPRMLSVFRIMMALLFLQHGTSKFFGFPVAAPEHMALFPDQIAGAIELVGSLFLLVGLFSRLAAFIMSGEMAVAYFMVFAPKGFFPFATRGELAVLFCLSFLYLVFAGPGPWSLDARRS